MKDLNNNEILKNTISIITNKYISFTCIALSAGIAGIILQNANVARGLHAIIFALTCGLIVLITYATLFGIIYSLLYLPKAIRWNGNIRRLEYFLVTIASFIIFVFDNLMYAPERYGLEYKPTNLMMIIGFTIAFFIIYIQMCACIKRLNDLKWSRWLAIIHLIPIVSLGIRIPCLFIKGKITTNDNADIDVNNSTEINTDDISENTQNSISSNKSMGNDNTNLIKEPLRTILIILISILITATICISVDYKYIVHNNATTAGASEKLLETKINLRNSYWIPISDTWSFDLNSIKQNDDYALIMSKNFVNERSESGHFVKYICYVDVFKRNSFTHKTVMTIALDDNMKQIEVSKFPFGHEPMEYPKDSIMEILRDIAFMTKDKIKNAKTTIDMGMVDYFSPYINIESPENIDPAEKRRKEEMFRRLVKEYEEQHNK